MKKKYRERPIPPQRTKKPPQTPPIPKKKNKNNRRKKAFKGYIKTYDIEIKEQGGDPSFQVC